MPVEKRVNIVQGDYFVSSDPDTVITTLLGSCVAACLFDPVSGVGGMNHFLLPGEIDGRNSAVAERMGAHLMELLVNGILKLGGSRHKLQAKLFGGAKTVAGLTDIGNANARFAQSFLAREGIDVVNASLGGDVGRRVQFWPASGRARQSFMSKSEPDPVIIHRRVAAAVPHAGEVELF